MGSFSVWHWVVVLLVVVLLFGTKKLRSLGTDMGAAVKGFKKGLKEDDSATTGDSTPGTDAADTVTASTSSEADGKS